MEHFTIKTCIMNFEVTKKTFSRTTDVQKCSAVEPEPRAEEPKLNCIPELEPKLRLRLRLQLQPRLLLFTTDLKKFIRKKSC